MFLEYLTLATGLAACTLCGLAHALGLRHYLSARKFKVTRWKSIHLWAGFISTAIVAWHGGYDWGWWLGVGFWLSCDYWMIVGTGIVALFCELLLPLKKFGGGKGKTQKAADLIENTRQWSLYLHLPATAAFWPLVFLHVFGKAYW